MEEYKLILKLISAIPLYILLFCTPWIVEKLTEGIQQPIELLYFWATIPIILFIIIGGVFLIFFLIYRVLLYTLPIE